MSVQRPGERSGEADQSKGGDGSHMGHTPKPTSVLQSHTTVFCRQRAVTRTSCCRVRMSWKGLDLNPAFTTCKLGTSLGRFAHDEMQTAARHGTGGASLGSSPSAVGAKQVLSKCQ